MNLTTAQFYQMKQAAINSSSNSYHLIYRNCTNWALDVFNSVRTNPITSFPINTPLYHLIPASPIGLYERLKRLKTTNAAERNNIEYGVVKYPEISHGWCP